MATGAGSGYARIVINAQNNTNPAFQQIQQSLNQMQSQLANQSGWKSVAAGAAIASAGMAVLGVAIEKAKEAFVQMVSVQREFDKLNNSLITATGSTENAKLAFEELQNFAKTTPYDLQQTVDAFIKLKDLGLDPSEKALRAYGDMAAAKGKTLSQLIEAVADASTFEFERLKEFGIKSKQEGDKVSFTFRGQTTEVKKSATDIQNYLLKVADSYAGTSDRLTNTLDGQLSALDDTYKNLLLTISGSGFNDGMKNIVSSLSDFISEVTDMFASGQIQAYFSVLTESFSDNSKVIAYIFNDFLLPIIDFVFTKAIPEIFNDFISGLTFISSGAYTIIKQMTVFIAQSIANVTAVIDGFVGVAKNAWKVVQNPINLDAWKSAASGINATIKQASTNLSNNGKIAQQQYSENYKKFKNDVIATDKAVEAASKKRAEFDKKQSSRKKYDLGSGYIPSPSSKDNNKDKGAKKAAQEADKLADALAKASIERAKLLAKQELDILTKAFNDKKLSAQKYYEERTKLETDALNKEIEAQKSVVSRKTGAEKVNAELALFKLEKQREDIIRNNNEEKTKYLETLKKEIDEIDISLLEKTGQYAKAEAIKATNQFKELKQKVLLDGTPEQKQSIFKVEELAQAEAKFAGITKEVDLQRQSLELTRQEIDNGSKSYSEYYSNLQNDIVKTRDEAIKMYEALLQSQTVLENPELSNKIREQVIELKGMGNEGEEVFKNLKSAVKEDLEKSMNGLLDGTMKVNDAFKSLGKTIIQSLGQSLSKNIAEGVTNMFFGGGKGSSSGGFDFSSISKVFSGFSGGAGSSGGGFDWSSMATSIGSWFGGAFASGGSVDGRPILVGEQGPEMFVPRIPGSIIPSSRVNQMGNGGSTINMTVVTQDAQSFKQNQGKITAGMYRGMAASNKRNN